MNDNKQNTTLLTVIAVATLLVAVVGATFAYFTASNANNSTSIIQATSGKMVITFADGSNDVDLTETNFQPGTNVLVNKTFTVVGNNTAKASGVSAPVGTDATGIAMPYYVGMRYTNEFTSDNNEGGLIYRIKGTVTKIENVDYADVHYTGSADGSTGYYTGQIPTSRTNGTSKTTSQGGNVYKIATSKDDYIRLAYGVFEPYSAAVTITFNFQILFPDNGKNQDSNKGCSFTGRIVINDIATGGEATSNITTQGA